MSFERIKYFGNISKDEVNNIYDYIIENKDLDNISCINDIMELFNVLEYINNQNVTIDYQIDIKQFSRQSSNEIGKYFGDRTLLELNEEYKNLERIYVDDFWEVFVNYGLIKRTNVNEFSKFILENQVHIYNLLNHSVISNKYSTFIKEHLLKNPRYLELFLDNYDSIRTTNLSFPKTLTSEDIDGWARRYCELADANPNYLKVIEKWSIKHEFKISDKVKVKARRSHDEKMNIAFKDNKGLEWRYEFGVQDLKGQDYLFEKMDGSNFKLYFSQSWLQDTLDQSSILNNLAYYFGLFNYSSGTFAYINEYNEPQTLMDHLSSKSKYEYLIGFISSQTHILFDLFFTVYYDFLHYEGVDLEEVFEFYYEEYLEEEFNISDFVFNKSSKSSSYYERAKSIIPELDSLLKQFDLFQENKEIDIELFEFNSKIKSYSELKSYSNQKFVYLHSSCIKDICRLLFSKQSPISFTNRRDQGSFYEKVVGKIRKEEFNDFQHQYIDDLMAHKMIGIDLTGNIYFKDIKYISLLNILWQKGYFCMFYLSDRDNLTDKIKEMVDLGDLKFGSTLFSNQENDYISYIMDNKKFNNGLAIRNKFTHGSFAKKSANEHKTFYLELLKILYLYTVRINEELEFYTTLQSK